MANKKITDLTLRSDADATCNIPVHDASQTWRCTLAQVKSFVLNAAGITDLTEDTAPDLDDDYISTMDASASSLKKVLFWRAKGQVVTAKSSSFTAAVADDFYPVATAGGAVTCTLPSAATAGRKRFTWFKSDNSTNLLTINRAGSDTIEGEDQAGGATSTTLATIGERLTLISDGTSKWFVEHRGHPNAPVAFTPTGNFTTNTTYTGLWRRRGDCMEVQVRLAFAGVPNTTTLVVNMPTGYTIDTAKLLSLTGAINSIGFGNVLDSGTTELPLVVRYSSTTAVAGFSYRNGGGAGAVYDIQNSVTQAVPIVVANGDAIDLYFKVPIVGWK
jgi:hypothetical protein